jgi:brefeldin A-resistance guanine nucleotide exchange factor 1
MTLHPLEVLAPQLNRNRTRELEEVNSHRSRKSHCMYSFQDLAGSVLTYFSVKAAVARGVKAISMIYSLTTRIPVLMEQSHLESKEAWAAYWSPIFRALTTQCTNPCREIRHQSFSSLQRSLLSPELTSGEHEDWTAIFGEVLFPLIVRLLKPEVYSSDPVGMSETRVQAATLLCRIFLHYLVLLSQWEGMLDLWLKILDIMDRLMNSGQGDSLVSLFLFPHSRNPILIITDHRRKPFPKA